MLVQPFSAPINSPHLRHSSSRTAVAELGPSDLLVANANFQASGEADPMKPASPPKQASSAMQSFDILSRLKAPFFLVWGFICFKICMESIFSLEAKNYRYVHLAFLFYNPLFLSAMMVWLWGVNLWVFSHSSVNYAKIFDLDHNHLTHSDIWKIAMWMTLVMPTSMTLYLYFYTHQDVSWAKAQPVIIYSFLALILMLPFDSLYMTSRFYFLRTIWRLTFPFQPISFADFFLADVLTSMAKVLSDFERVICMMINGEASALEEDGVCGSHSVLIPCVLAYPYVCRFFQCLRQYKDTREKQCLLNALKYSTAFPVILLSALKYHVVPEMWINVYRPLWLLSSLINSCYSFYWDVTRDWDLSVFSRIFKPRSPQFRSNNMLYGRRWVYYWAVGSNLLLRCAWTYKLSAHLRHNHWTVFTITAMEMIRRFQWIFFRVENEWNKMALKANLQIPLKDVPVEKEHLLGTTDHDV